jgi:hypothetical protein
MFHRSLYYQSGFGFGGQLETPSVSNVLNEHIKLKLLSERDTGKRVTAGGHYESSKEGRISA